MLQRFIRKPAAIELSGFGYTEFHEAIRDGRFPKPDGYLGPRSPFWAEHTIVNWQAAQIGSTRPTETRPNRRRRPAAKTEAA